MATSEFPFASVKGKIIMLRNHLGKPCVGTGWLVQPEFWDQGKVSLTNIVTGMSHFENWIRIKAWLEQGRLAVSAEEPAMITEASGAWKGYFSG